MHTDGEIAECTQSEEDGCIGGSIVDSVRDVGYMDMAFGTSPGINLIVASTWES